MLAVPEPVRAQGLFDLLGSIFRGVAPRAYRVEPPRLLEGFPGEGEFIDEPMGGPHVAYCVRTCDGRYFPLPAGSRGQGATPAKLCGAMCPAAQTRVYSGSSIEGAVANDGKRYKELKHAFLYRNKLVADCTCNGRDTAGVASLDAKDDPTLRPGDIVVTAEGPQVFAGSSRTPHESAAFVPVQQARGLQKSVRENLSQMRVAPERLTATVISGTSKPEDSIGVPAKPALTLAPDEGEAQQN